MITYEDARDAAEFHVARDSRPCQVWHRAGEIHPMPNGGWLVFIETEDTDDPADRGSDWHHITPVNAAGFHTLADCPLANLPSVGASQVGPDLADAAGYGEDGYNAFGYDAQGFNRDGYDASGYDADGYDADGYDADGDDRYGRNRDKPDASSLDLADEWSAFSGYNHDAFLDHLREKVADPDEIDDIEFCGNCEEPAWSGDLTRTGRRTDICQSCWDDWYTCEHCDERFPNEDMNSTLGDDYICDRCRDRYYSWCSECEGYYPDEYADDHYHDSYAEDCDCESPQPEFAIRNDGSEPLRNDVRVEVVLAEGVISAEGLAAIRDYLREQGMWDLSDDLHALGEQWQTREGNYSKRLSRLAYRSYQAKLTPEILSRVGNIARDHSTNVSVAIEITRDLNQSPDYFYHEGSCWWAGGDADYHESRCAFKTNGGFALRSFNGYGGVSGRAWVMPLRMKDGKLRPTFETLNADAFAVFNGYGNLSGYDPARILAHMAGWTYRKFSNFSCDPMYINSGTYLVAPEPIAEQYDTDGELYLEVSQHSSLYEREREEHSYA